MYKALETRFSLNEHHSWTPASHQRHGTTLISQFMQRLPIIHPYLFSIQGPPWPAPEKISMHPLLCFVVMDAIMKTLKRTFISPPILLQPHFSESMKLKIDAINVQIGCVILQRFPGNANERIEYCSHFLTGAENRYNTTRCKFLTIEWAVLLLPPYEDKHRFNIHTEHDAIRWIINFADPTDRVA